MGPKYECYHYILSCIKEIGQEAYKVDHPSFLSSPLPLPSLAELGADMNSLILFFYNWPSLMKGDNSEIKDMCEDLHTHKNKIKEEKEKERNKSKKKERWRKEKVTERTLKLHSIEGVKPSLTTKVVVQSRRGMDISLVRTSLSALAATGANVSESASALLRPQEL